MNTFTLAFRSLRFHALSNVLNVVVLALGVATIITLLRLSGEVEERFTHDLNGIDLVVGAKGSPLQLILSSVFHLDVPTGNIPLKEADALEKNRLVKSAIPIALGDNYRSFRIVGTTVDYIRHYNGELAAGRLYNQQMEAVLGSEVARISASNLGDKIIGAHGLVNSDDLHTDFPYTVVGILQPTGTVLDRLVLTPVESVWHVHEHPDADDPEEVEHKKEHPEQEITALLITYKSPLAAASLPRLVNKTSSMQAASPAFETQKLFRLLGSGSDAVRLFGALLMGIAGFGLFVTLFHAGHDRRYDIALLRALGATPTKIFTFVLNEGLMLGLMGTLLGLCLGHVISGQAEHYIAQSRHIMLTVPETAPYEGWIILAAIGVSVAAALLPAWLACRVNVAQLLAKGS